MDKIIGNEGWIQDYDPKAEKKEHKIQMKL